MTWSHPKIPALSLLPEWLHRLASQREMGELHRSAIVFAPHQDDETLGCGGTIIRKRAAGAPLRVVFMTDGGRSHSSRIDADSLSEIRKQEALDAVVALGCTKEDVLFLESRDGRLSQDIPTAIERVAAIIQKEPPEEVYVPYESDGPPDHEATYVIVREALRQCRHPAVVYEYPIWFWNQWPWVKLDVVPTRKGIEAIKKSLMGGLGAAGLWHFRSAVFVGDVLQQKKEALSRHRSQMMSLTGDPAWQTLHDVAGGDFLECFFRPFEVFRKRLIPQTSNVLLSRKT